MDRMEYLVKIESYLLIYLSIRLLKLVRLGKMFVSTNVGVSVMKWWKKRFSRICSEIGVDPK